MLSPLNLESFQLEALEIVRNPDFGLSTEVHAFQKIDLEILLARHPERLSYRIGFDVNFLPAGEEKRSYRFNRLRIRCFGIFSFPDDTPPETVQQLLPLNGLAIVYGVARGMVAQATALTEEGPYLLPAVNFVEALRLQYSPETEVPAKPSRKRKKRMEALPVEINEALPVEKADADD